MPNPAHVGELSPLELASACRRAYVRIVVGAHVGWGKLELARWLTGPYHELAVHEPWVAGSAAGGTAPLPMLAPASIVAANDTSLTDDRVTILLETMRTDVLAVLRELMNPDGVAALTNLAFDTALVARVLREGDWSVVPRARGRMTLVDRVLSLVTVDAMTRPEDFEHSFFVCSRCDQPAFDVAARPRGVCRVHVSGVSRP